MSKLTSGALGSRRCFICDKDFSRTEYKVHMEDHSEDIKSLKFSNNSADYCRTACKLCGKIVMVNAMRGHTKKDHDLGITEYKTNFNQHYYDLVEKVFHQCGICQEIILFDSDSVAQHLKGHKVEQRMTHKEYNDAFLTMRVVSGPKGEEGPTIKRPPFIPKPPIDAMASKSLIKPEKSSIKPEKSSIKPDKSFIKPEKSVLKPDKSLTKPDKSVLKPEVGFHLGQRRTITDPLSDLIENTIGKVMDDWEESTAQTEEVMPSSVKFSSRIVDDNPQKNISHHSITGYTPTATGVPSSSNSALYAQNFKKMDEISTFQRQDPRIVQTRIEENPLSKIDQAPINSIPTSNIFPSTGKTGFGVISSKSPKTLTTKSAEPLMTTFSDVTAMTTNLSVSSLRSNDALETANNIALPNVASSNALPSITSNINPVTCLVKSNSVASLKTTNIVSSNSSHQKPFTEYSAALPIMTPITAEPILTTNNARPIITNNIAGALMTTNTIRPKLTTNTVDPMTTNIANTLSTNRTNTPIKQITRNNDMKDSSSKFPFNSREEIFSRRKSSEAVDLYPKLNTKHPVSPKEKTESKEEFQQNSNSFQEQKITEMPIQRFRDFIAQITPSGVTPPSYRALEKILEIDPSSEEAIIEAAMEFCSSY